MGIFSATSGAKNGKGYGAGTAKLVKQGKTKAAKAAKGKRSV